MRTLTKIIGGAAALSLVFSLTGLTAQAAATAPNLGTSAGYSVLANSSMAANGAGTTVSNYMGLSTGLAVSRTGTWLPALGRTEYFGPLSPAATAQTDAIAASGTMAGEASDGTWSLSTHPAPGVWTDAGSPVFAGTLVLNGGPTDVWVFQLSTDFTFTGTVTLTGGAQACNVFWEVNRDATINSGGAGTQFVGTLIAGRDVSLVGGVTVDGRIISNRDFTAAGGDSISGPTCAAAPTGTSSRTGNITVVKTVINDNGGTKTVADFPLFINNTALVVSGQPYPFYNGNYTVTETADSQYAATFSGDCDSTGHIGLNAGDNRICIVTNNDIGTPVAVPPVPPIIDVVKVPSPLSLPDGPGAVQYTYTLRNIGTVPVSNVTMVGDTCSPITLVSGDTNGDSKLDVNETWKYTCSTRLAATHTNTVVATGWANGISATDIASATVVVGAPIVPPIIHVTKVPNPLKLNAPGGIVTYTEKVSNPGTVALSNVTVKDDKCSPMRYISGDTNRDNMLEPDETFTYTCQAKLTQTTMNTAVATGEANGMIARDFAIATVVVAAPVPKLPNTGVGGGSTTPWNIALLAGLLLLASASAVIVLKKSKI